MPLTRLAVLLSTLFCSAICSATPPFLHAPSSSFDTDFPLTAVAVGDFKEDGFGDVVVAGNTLATHAGVGDGSFLPPAAIAKRTLPGVPRSIAVGDLNHDGHLDVVATLGDAIAVVPGLGNGRFGTPVTYGSLSAPDGVALAFFNADGHPDVVVANSGSNSVTVFLGSLTGPLSLGGTYAAGGTPVAVAAGDVDGDGDIDLATACPTDGIVSILLGAGDGSFGAPTPYSASSPHHVALVAIDGDEHRDLLAGSRFGTALAFRSGIGDGSFGSELPIETGTLAYGFGVGDWDGDGDADAVVSGLGCCRGTSRIATFVRNSGGLLGDPVDVPAGAGVGTLAVGELGDDDRPDVVVVNNATEISFHVAFVTVRSDNGGTAGWGRMIPLAAAPYFVRAGDVDGDGVLDLVVFDDALQVHRGLGGGSFAPPIPTPTPFATLAVAVGDLDGNGRSDVILLSSSFVSILAGQADGTFGSPTSYPVPSGRVVQDVAVADFDGNGALDVAVGHFIITGRVGFVMMNPGSGLLAAPLDVVTGVSTAAGGSIDVADFDGDGRLDLCFGHDGSPYLNTFRGMGDGTFVDGLSLGAFFALGRLSIDDVAAADVDGDGRADAVACGQCSAGGPHCDDPHTMAAWRSTAGMFTQAVPNGAGSRSVVAGMLSGDALADVVVANEFSNTISTYRGSATGLQRIDHPAGDAPRDLEVADLNGDGRMDVAVANTWPASIRIFDGAFGVADVPRAGLASGLVLEPPAPNPASHELRLAFTLPSRGPMALRVIDVAGRHVATIVEGVLEAGRHQARWNRRDVSDAPVRAGVYFCELRAAGSRLSTRFAIIR